MKRSVKIIISTVAVAIAVIAVAALSVFFVPHKHRYSKRTVRPTCETSGYTQYTCRCGDFYVVDRIAATGHEPIADAAVPATCSEMGFGAGSHCAVCGEVLEKQCIIERLPHVDTDTDGMCDVCGSYIEGIHFDDISFLKRLYSNFVCKSCSYYRMFKNKIGAVVM